MQICFLPCVPLGQMCYNSTLSWFPFFAKTFPSVNTDLANKCSEKKFCMKDCVLNLSSKVKLKATFIFPLSLNFQNWHVQLYMCFSIRNTFLGNITAFWFNLEIQLKVKAKQIECSCYITKCNSISSKPGLFFGTTVTPLTHPICTLYEHSISEGMQSDVSAKERALITLDYSSSIAIGITGNYLALLLLSPTFWNSRPHLTLSK